MGRTWRWAALTASGLIAAGLLVGCSQSDGGSAPEGTADLPPIPAGLPRTLELGIASPDGHAARTNEIAPFGFRYQYLAGGRWRHRLAELERGWPLRRTLHRGERGRGRSTRLQLLHAPPIDA